MKLVALGMLAAIALSAGEAGAHDERVHLEFEVGAGCPASTEFMAQVRARTERVRFVDATLDARELKVTAQSEGDHAVGGLRLGTAQEDDRLVTGKTCVDVISALALIAALAIDPTALPAGTSQAQVGAAVAATSAQEPSAHEERSPEAAFFRPLTPETANPSTEARSPPWFGALGARGEISRGLGQDTITLVGASAYGEVGLELADSWRPAVRISALLGQSPTVLPRAASDAGAATFTLVAGRLSLYPVEFRPRATFVVRPSASLEIGRLVGKGETLANGSVTETRSGAMTRVAVVQSIQGQVRLGSVMWLELEVGASEPLVRQKFVFYNPDVTVSSVPVIELAGALGVGLHFP